MGSARLSYFLHMRKTPETTRLFEIAEPVCLDSGYELVDLQLKQDQRGAVLQVFIDRAAGADGGSVGLSDCERVSRELGTLLDVEDVIERQYSLEVSSPGVARPLRTLAHFVKYAGSGINITLAPGVEGRRRFKGTLLSATTSESGSVVNVEVDGSQHTLCLDDIESAQLVPNWDELFEKAAAAR